ncbi:MAG TPA: D-alanine--D-alanine ligase [Myxococcota bacterium]|nr:D-alanine--D-alanine ligase [Myxococcota bacterium]HRY92375.1 D-alanine--D-alanine ligase [Myxococcota bacterium]HSA24075.1 D-alanine--D-alanine ligase [Myxococcota bacterium]
MRVGLTYDLRDDYLAEGYSLEETAEFDKPDTIEGIEGALRALGYQTERIGHARALIQRLCAGDRWDLVFNIAEGLWGLGREAQVPAILDVYRIPYVFSDPVVLGLTLHKAFTKAVLRDAGVPTPDYFTVERPEQISEVKLAFPVFAKPLAEGTGKGIGPRSRCQDARELDEVCRELLAHFHQPVLVERFLPGREVTVGVVGTGPRAEALGCIEVKLLSTAAPDAYGYENKEKWVGRVEYALAPPEVSREACDVALAAWRVLGCRDGGRVDLRADEHGRMNIIELNPLAGINPTISDLPILCYKLGMTYAQLIERIMRSALERCGLTPPEARP